MDITAIREDLGLAIETTGLTAVITKPGSVNPPAGILGPYNVDYHVVMGGAESSALTILISVVVADAADGAIEDLDAYLSDTGDKSIALALETYASDNWSSLKVLPTEDVSLIQVGATEFVGCQFQVEILA